jgi:hypothetical protein
VTLSIDDAGLALSSATTTDTRAFAALSDANCGGTGDGLGAQTSLLSPLELAVSDPDDADEHGNGDDEVELCPTGDKLFGDNGTDEHTAAMKTNNSAAKHMTVRRQKVKLTAAALYVAIQPAPN